MHDDDVCVCACTACSAPGGDLQTLIDDNIVPYESDVVTFTRQLVEGLAYLHQRKIAHLDIKVGLREGKSRPACRRGAGGTTSENVGVLHQFRSWSCEGSGGFSSRCSLQPQNLVMMGDFPDCDVKLCDFEISRVILEGTEIREILGTPDYVGAYYVLYYHQTCVKGLLLTPGFRSPLLQPPRSCTTSPSRWRPTCGTYGWRGGARLGVVVEPRSTAQHAKQSAALTCWP